MRPSLEIHGLLVEHDQDICDLICAAFGDSPIRFTVVPRADQAIEFIDSATRFQTPLDFFLVELVVPGGRTSRSAGIDVLRRVRSAPDEQSVAGGFRLRHLPFIAMTGHLDVLDRTQVEEIDHDLPFLTKPFQLEELVKQVSESLRTYRHSILQDFQRSGRAIFWKDGEFRVADALTPRQAEGKYWAGPMIAETLPTYSKLVMMCEGWLFGESAVSEFETLINSPKTNERDLQRFFNQHPEFLDRNHDSYWSEPFLKSMSDRTIIRPDFLFQARGQRELPWTWKIVDLKQPRARMFSSRKFHPTFSSEVYRLKTQLEDYGRFFDDPRNADMLRARFGGVLPRPQLAGLIGRIPAGDFERFTALRENLAGVKITTYDEVLDSRREYVNWMKRLLGD